MWEQNLLFWIHSHRTPFLDRVFLLTELLGTPLFFAILATVAAVWHFVRSERRKAYAWVGISVSIYCLQWLLKTSLARPRPTFWTPLITEPGYAFPSGHALGAAAFYPLLAWTIFASCSKRKW